MIVFDINFNKAREAVIGEGNVNILKSLLRREGYLFDKDMPAICVAFNNNGLMSSEVITLPKLYDRKNERLLTENLTIKNRDIAIIRCFILERWEYDYNKNKLSRIKALVSSYAPYYNKAINEFNGLSPKEKSASKLAELIKVATDIHNYAIKNRKLKNIDFDNLHYLIYTARRIRDVIKKYNQIKCVSYVGYEPETIPQRNKKFTDDNETIWLYWQIDGLLRRKGLIELETYDELNGIVFYMKCNNCAFGNKRLYIYRHDTIGAYEIIKKYNT